MSREANGSGRIYSRNETERIRSRFGPQVAVPLDLNRAKSQELAAHPLIGKRLAAELLRLRSKGRIATPADLYHAGLINRSQLRKLESGTFGATSIRPLLTRIEIDGPRLYVDEPFSLQFEWLAPAGTRPVILSVAVHFPSGRVSGIQVRVSKQHLKAGRLTLPGFSSGESGELYVLATLRDEAGGVSQLSAVLGVFTRNPVQIFVTPDYFTQSGGAGAPKYNFDNNRWYCYARGPVG